MTMNKWMNEWKWNEWYYDDERNKTVFHTTQHQTCKPKTKTKTDFWSQTGLVLKPTVSDHIIVIGIHHQTQSIVCWYSCPGVQHGQTEISVDDVRCHQWLTNQIAEAPLHWRQDQHTSSRWHLMWIASSLFMSATKRSTFLRYRAGHTLLVLGTGVYGVDTERTAFPYPL